MKLQAFGYPVDSVFTQGHHRLLVPAGARFHLRSEAATSHQVWRSGVCEFCPQCWQHPLVWLWHRHLDWIHLHLRWHRKVSQSVYLYGYYYVGHFHNGKDKTVVWCRLPVPSYSTLMWLHQQQQMSSVGWSKKKFMHGKIGVLLGNWVLCGCTWPVGLCIFCRSLHVHQVSLYLLFIFSVEQGKPHPGPGESPQVGRCKPYCRHGFAVLNVNAVIISQRCLDMTARFGPSSVLVSFTVYYTTDLQYRYSSVVCLLFLTHIMHHDAAWMWSMWCS